MRRLSVFRSRFFWSLYAAMVAVLLVTAVLIGVSLNQRLEGALLKQLEQTLQDQCVLLRETARQSLSGEYERDLQDYLRGIRVETGVRVTFIREDGSVLGDSDEDPAEMDDHLMRPEVVDARAGASGSSMRLSRTVGYRMLYVAQRVHGPRGPLGFVRVSMPVTEVEARLADTRRSVILGTALGFLLALVLGFYVARLFTTPLAAITRAAEGLRAGDYESRVEVDSKGELGLLADTLNRLGEEVTRRIARLSQEDAQLRAMLAGMVEGVVAVEENDRISFVNDAARKLLGVEERGIEGRRLWELAPIAEIESLLTQARRSAAPSRREIELFRGERERVLDVHASSFQGGGRRGLVMVMHDITDLRRLERIRRDFVANVSHELKTPLTSIKGFVETLLSGALHDEENNVRFLERIDANVERLNHLVSDLLSLARIESEHDGVVLCEVDLREVLDEVWRRHEGPLQKKGLAFELSGEGRVGVLGDRESLVQVLDNLLDNAIKYTPAQGNVHVSLRKEGEQGVVEVADTGIGIPAADLDRVFERFYRVDKARSRDLGGTGLGLSIVKNLVVRMGGEVRVESEEGRGTRFLVTLPLAEPTGGAGIQELFTSDTRALDRLRVC